MTEIFDRAGNRIEVGMRVVDRIDAEIGTVVLLTEPDGDVNEYGRPIAIGPLVGVQYDDGDYEAWLATWNATGPWDSDREDFTCDDVLTSTSSSGTL